MQCDSNLLLIYPGWISHKIQIFCYGGLGLECWRRIEDRSCSVVTVMVSTVVQYGLLCLNLIAFCPKGPSEFNFILADLDLDLDLWFMLAWSVDNLHCTDPSWSNLLKEVA